MPFYDYQCDECGFVQEFMHGMKEEPQFVCRECGAEPMRRLISAEFTVATSYHAKETVADYKESEHRKKVKDPERAVRMRKQMFGHSAVGDPSMKTDPKHVVRKGRALGGQTKEIDKAEFIKAAAKSDSMVKIAQDALKKKGQNSG